MMVNQRFSSEHGMITVDFLFALVLVMGFSAILFALSFTLTVAEITQYVTFATARTYMAGHLSLGNQELRARQKYLELLTHPNLIKLYTNGWFEVQDENNFALGDITRFNPTLPPDPVRNMFYGAGTSFTARMLDFKIPFYGSTTPEDRQGKSGFRSFIASYLGREVTEEECMKFVEGRWSAIRNLPVTGGMAGYGTNNTDNGYKVYDDNGC